jgi:hypothetical protein
LQHSCSDQYKRIKSYYNQQDFPSPHPSPQRGEGRVRGPHVQEINAFVLICTNGLVAKTEVKAAYNHLSIKALAEFPQVLERMSLDLAKKKDQFRISFQTKVDNPLATLENFDHQFQINKKEQEVVKW